MARLLDAFLSDRTKRERAERDHPNHPRQEMSVFAELEQMDGHIHAHGVEMRDACRRCDPGGRADSDPIGPPLGREPRDHDPVGTPRHMPGLDPLEDSVLGSLDDIGADPVENERGLLSVEFQLDLPQTDLFNLKP